MRGLLLVVALLVSGPAWADFFGTTPPCIVNCTFTNPTITGGTINNTVIGGVSRLGPTITLPPAYRKPGQADDITQNHPAGAVWVDPTGNAWTSQRSTTGLAWWAIGSGVQSGSGSPGTTYPSGYSQVGGPLPCDLLAVAACYGTKLLKTAYAGASVNLTRLSDGSSFDIGFVNGSFDTFTWMSKCWNTTCRVVKVYNQDASGNDAAAIHAPLVIATTGTNTVASTAGMQVNDHIDTATQICKVDTYVATINSGAGTFTTNNGCTIPTGNQVMFSQAPLMTFQQNVGNSPAIILDAEAQTWNITAQLSVPAGVTVGSKTQGGIMVMRANSVVRGFTYFALAQTGATGQAWSLFSNAGSTQARTYDGGSTWNTPVITNTWGGLTPHILSWIADSADQAFASPKVCIDEFCNQFGFASGNATLTGGYIGYGGGYTNVPGGDAQMAFSAFVLYSVNPTKTQITAAQTAAYSLFGLRPQNRQYQVVTGPDSLMQGPENAGMWNTPWQLADLAYDYGVRLTNAGWTAQTNVYWNSNFSLISQTIQASARKVIVVWYPSYNDYPGNSSCASYFSTTMTALINKFTAISNVKLLMLTVPSANFVSTDQQWMADCNARVIANAGALGYAYYDLASDPAFAGTWYNNAWQTIDGVHPTNVSSSVWVNDILPAALQLMN